MSKVACVGILVADVILGPVNSYPDKGMLEKVDSITVHNGGNAMTASINIKKLGVDTSIIGLVGNDMFGDFLRMRLKDYGVDTAGLKADSNTQTSASVVLVDKDAERSFLHCVGANAVFSHKDIDYGIIEKCDIVFVTGTFLMTHFDGEETRDFLKKCKEMGKITLLDVCWDASGQWGSLIDMCIPYIDYFMPSIDEAKCIAGKENPDDIADVFFSRGATNVVIKLGSSGSYFRKKGDLCGKVYKSFKVNKVADTTGAGDSFCSGFIAALALDMNIDECMEFANAVGALSVMEKGATAGTKSFDETLKFINDRKGE